MQTIEPKISEAFLNFTQTIKSPKTRTNYIQSLKYYMKFSRVENYDDLLINADPKDIQRNIIMFIEFCKNKGLSSSTIKGYTASIKHFYESNDIEGLKWRKIIAHHPADQKVIDDRAYTHDELFKMISIANLRDKAIVLLMCSCGLRVDAVHPLRIKDLTSVEYNNAEFYEIRIYALSSEEYRGYCTPEAKNAIDDYLRYRKQCGERITENSPLFRKEFSRRDDMKLANAVSITRASINFIIAELLDRSGVRPRQRMTPEELQRGINTKRTQLPMNHGMRKFTITNMIRARLEPNARRLLVGQDLEGMDAHYDRRDQSELLEQYYNGIDFLTISPENKLRRENQQLIIKASEVNQALAEINEVKKHLGLI